jgi:uncharacterized membrane protein
MDSKGKMLASLLLIILPVIFGFLNYVQLPDQMAIHWGLNGEANGTSDKLSGLLILPIISVFLLGLFAFIPKIDPLKKNYASFRKYYDNFVIVMIGFFSYTQLLVLFWNLSVPFNFTRLMAFGFGAMFYYLGILLENAKPNWFIGIRTPWTLSNNKVWDKTHHLGGKLYKSVGIVTLIGAIIFEEMLIVSVALIIAASLATVVYSYLEFKKLK